MEELITWSNLENLEVLFNLTFGLTSGKKYLHGHLKTAFIKTVNTYARFFFHKRNMK